MHRIQLQYDFRFSACDSSLLPPQVSHRITLFCTAEKKNQTNLWLQTQLSCLATGSLHLPSKAFKHRNLVSSSPHFKHLPRPFPTFPFQRSLRNSYTHCPAIARHSGSAIDKDQRGDRRMGKGIQQRETEKPELHFLFCSGFPGSLGELPAAAISQHPALGATMAYGASRRPLGRLIWASPTACGKMPSQSRIFGLTP